MPTNSVTRQKNPVKLASKKVSLYECMNARYPMCTIDALIVCRAGHPLPKQANLFSILHDKPLYCAECQGCPDIDYEPLTAPWNGKMK